MVDINLSSVPDPDDTAPAPLTPLASAVQPNTPTHVAVEAADEVSADLSAGAGVDGSTEASVQLAQVISKGVSEEVLAAVRIAATSAVPTTTAAARPAPPTAPEYLQAWQKLQVALGRAPWQHDYFQLLRWVDALHPQLPRLGQALRPRDEALRIGQDPELSFAPAALHSFGPNRGGLPRVGQRFFGLFGPMGPMPLHVTEYVRERQRSYGDATPQAFADIFQHRASLLFYRAWAQAQPVSHIDRPGDDAFGRWVGAIAGLGQPTLLGRDHVADHAKRLHAGALARGPGNAEGLVHIVSQYFKVPVRLESYVGHWLQLDPAQRLALNRPASGVPAGRRLGRATAGAGGGSAAGSRQASSGVVVPGLLGQSAAAGSRVWDRQSRFRLHLGPLSLAQYESFLPGQPALLALRDWLRLYAGLGLSCEIRLILRGADVPAARLGCVEGDGDRGSERDGGRGGVKLGRTSWLGPRRGTSQASSPDRGDLAFLVEPAA
jgi:type VI secretion system protein ImpH